MTHAESGSDLKRSREKLLADFNTVIADTEQLLKSLAGEGSERAQALRTRAEESLSVARERLSEAERQLEGKARAAADVTEGYVREHPWQTLGIAAAFGVLVGLLLNRR